MRQASSKTILALLLVWFASVAGADAPYVFLKAAPASITVEAVGALPAFAVLLRPPAKPAPDTLKLPKGTSLFVVADTHGEYEILAGMLRAHRVVDAKLAWSFGRGQLVVLGDIFDRGPNHTEILWLLYSLEAQARAAGGGVQVLIGNHEAMVMRGDLRYLNPKYPEVARSVGVPSYSALVGNDTVLGQWLRSRPAVMRIDRALYLHGGISPAIVDRKLTLARINGTIRGLLDGTLPDDLDSLELSQFLMKEQGPLWYRGYFPNREPGPDKAPGATDEDITRILKHFAVDRIVVGHTTVPTVEARYGGRVIAANVYPKREADGAHFEALLVRDGKVQRARLDGTVEPL